MSIFTTLNWLVPPPRYMTLPGYGVDISDTSLKFIELSKTARGQVGYTITNWGEIAIPGGVLQQGEIINPQQLSEVLKEFKQLTKAEFVRVSLPEERAYIFETSLKKSVTTVEMRNLLEFRLEENVPIPSREVLFDYLVEENGVNDRSVSVIVAAYARETVMQYHDACIAAGLLPTSFEVEAQAMARAVVPSDVSGATLMIDFGKTRTGIGIVVNNTLRFTSTIEIGGSQLSEALRKVLGDKSEAEITTIKNTEGLVRRLDSILVFEALMPVVSVIRDELINRMQYWHTHNNLHPERRINSIILCGGSANLRGLPEYFSETIGVPAVRAEVWQHVLEPGIELPPVDKAHSYGYATAIGLALQQIV